MIATFGTYVRNIAQSNTICDLTTAFLDVRHEGKPYSVHCVLCYDRYA